jgi:hypothetical protein
VQRRYAYAGLDERGVEFSTGNTRDDNTRDQHQDDEAAKRYSYVPDDSVRALHEKFQCQLPVQGNQ